MSEPGGYREKAMREYGDECVECGGGENTVVHHIDNDPDNDSIENLTVLCRSCHGKVHLGVGDDLPHLTERLEHEREPSGAVRVPRPVYDEAVRLVEERGYATLGAAIRFMCREGGFDV